MSVLRGLAASAVLGALGGVLALVVARVRARDNLQHAALGLAGALLSFALRRLREQ